MCQKPGYLVYLISHLTECVIRQVGDDCDNSEPCECTSETNMPKTANSNLSLILYTVALRTTWAK